MFVDLPLRIIKQHLKLGLVGREVLLHLIVHLFLQEK